jgi:hypothetical protein
MQQNRYKYFRWTARTARISFMYAIVVPSAFIYMAYTTEVRLNRFWACPWGFQLRMGLGRGLGSADANFLRYLQGKYDLRGKLRGNPIVEF